MVRKRSLNSLRTVLLQESASEQPRPNTTAFVGANRPHHMHGTERHVAALTKQTSHQLENIAFLPSWLRSWCQG